MRMHILIAMLSIGATAYGQVPPSNDTSDPTNNNTGVGTGTLQSNGGSENTAVGVNALALNTTGYENTATGVNALVGNTTGFVNTAFGYATLMNNTTGGGNTANGYIALVSNTTGSNNTAVGISALQNNTTGENNAATGGATLSANTTGFTNSAFGGSALLNNTTGAQNTAIGGAALLSNTTGNNNIGVGMNAGSGITTGNNNIAIGLDAGSNLTTGSADIDIANAGVVGESHTIRIGDAGQHTKTFIAGIWGSVVKPGNAVFVSPDGRLGVAASSERYKTDIATMGSNTSKISQLRPVTFHLKSDATGELQYGLIAEEVDKVFPELVVRDEAGKIEGVRYDELAPMLLSEMQQQAAEIRDLKQQVAELNSLKLEMRAALVALKSKDQLVARR